MRPCTLLLAALCCTLVACGGRDSRKEITQSRTVAAVAADAAHSHDRPSPALTWDVPEGWVRTNPRPMRLVNFQVGEAPGAECYISVLSGEAGGAERNVNRWRRQMGHEDPLGPEAVAGLHTITVLGTPAPLVEVAGRFTGAGEPQPGYMLLGTICELDTETVFVKMIGPEATILAERDSFVSFCESLRACEETQGRL